MNVAVAVAYVLSLLVNGVGPSASSHPRDAQESRTSSPRKAYPRDESHLARPSLPSRRECSGQPSVVAIGTRFRFGKVDGVWRILAISRGD
jgi:hypothetical protein